MKPSSTTGRARERGYRVPGNEPGVRPPAGSRRGVLAEGVGGRHKSEQPFLARARIY